MRIVAGEFRGRRLQSPKKRDVRPTSDRVREAVFSMIAARLPGARVLDLFAGTGALGLEALSRGAARAVFVDESGDAIRLIWKNIESCGVKDRVEVLQGPAAVVLRRLAGKGRGADLFHLAFLDPPYGLGDVEKTMGLLPDLMSQSGLVVAEHHRRDVLPERLKDWCLLDQRRYGDTMISLFVRDKGAGATNSKANDS
jgi:16S rRNA (guanine966-N2)-methyltransferase